ncbi:MAG: DEAD/DEAH box helicase, partial [Deltaproteobacteria bacterium]|nr:DEAD/DEAH box helicase [Deltaproteobacteria bacterium]
MTEIRHEGFYHHLIPELARRSARAFISSLDPASAPLRRALFELFEKPPNQGESFVGDPVFEAAFGWETAATTLGDLAGELLHSTLVDALDAPPSEFKDQRLPRTLKPYKHQIESWRALAQEPPRSIVVSSGTGSGKTECFAIPLFNDLLVQADRQGSRPLVGVRALMLYPLNALIANQRDRFRAWLHTLAGRVRFGLYNGHTPEDMPAGARRHEEARSRKEIRDAPPPLLVTNPTMLEYMLVRSEDRPIIAASRGKLRWIVLDEAHTYVGSQAAEIALLLRRVLHAFEVDATDVRFIATSATISSGADASSREALQRFLADLAGVSTARVSIIEGRRRKPSLTTGGASEGNETISVPSSLPEDLGDLEDLPQGDPLELFDRLKASAEACALRDALLEGPKTLSHLAALQGATQARPAEGRDPRVADERTLRLLDIATQARHDGEAFLPLRGHVFHRTQRGLWACVNPACPGKKGTPLDDPAWSFGSLHTARRATCPHCDALVAELVLCRSCGKEYLLVSEEVQADGSILCARSYETEVEAEDLFVDAETSVASDDDSETSDDVSKETALAETSLAEPGQDPVPRTRPVQVKRSLGRLVAPRDLPDLRYITLDLKTGYLDSSKGVPIALVPPEEDGLFRCRVCGVVDRKPGQMLRPTSAGAPFFLSVSIPALLEHLRPERHGDAWVPHEGRRAISFTDSRQGTARFALRSQIDAERAFVRSWLYHRLWDKAQVAAAATPDTETIEKKSQQLKTLESLPPDSGMDDLIEGLRADIAKATQIVPGVLSWSDAVLGLTACDEVKAMMRQWQERLAVEFDARQVAELLLYREVLRRLRRQRGLEGLGLLALTYEGLDRIKQVPASWRRRGQDVDSWRVFLRLLLDFFVRDRACLLVSDDEVRWLGVPWRARYLVGPDATHLQRNQVRWPRVPKGARRPSRMVTYLARVFGLDLKDRAAAADVDAIFVDAWDALRAKGFLEHPGDAGYQFNFKNQVAFTTISQGVVCPLTRSVLAEVLGNLTPYLTADTDDVHSRCTPITLPKLPFPFGGDAKTLSDRREHLMAWLETESSVRSAREAGIWTEFSDRIASNAAYFSVGEHSAQQTALVLRRFEDDFKAGKLNLLSCSTTMELGVDIGGLSAVAMNNAPPGPANFLQRAGRAGRRGETSAVSLTLCKSVPHGEAVFRDPLWPFVTPIHVPQVSLSSEPIVSRHVGALLLTRFLTLGEKRKRARSMLTLSCGHFFVALAKRPAPVARFKDWLDAEAPQDPWIVKGMKRLVAGTLLSGR